MLLASDLYKYFVDIESVTIAFVPTLQSTGVFSSKLDAPESDGLMTDCDTAFSEEIFDIPVAEVEAVVEPDGVTDDVGWESVALVCIHCPIVEYRQLTCQYRFVAEFRLSQLARCWL